MIQVNAITHSEFVTSLEYDSELAEILRASPSQSLESIEEIAAHARGESDGLSNAPEDLEDFATNLKGIYNTHGWPANKVVILSLSE